MKTYFDNLREIEWSKFLNIFEQHVERRHTEDITERKILEHLKGATALKSYLAELNESGLKNLILPHHAVEMEPGKNPDRPVKTGGEEFQRVIRDYAENFIRNARFSECAAKAQSQKQRFFDATSPVLKAEFLLVCNQKEYTHSGDHYDTSHGENRLYIGNGFHRFIAYGLWIYENGFKPLEVYYVEVST